MRYDLPEERKRPSKLRLIVLPLTLAAVLCVGMIAVRMLVAATAYVIAFVIGALF